MSKSFTTAYGGLANILITPVQVAHAYNEATDSKPPAREYKGLWDTGATASVITQKVIDELGLLPIGMTEAHGVDGTFNTQVFLVSFGLPNAVTFSTLRVTRGKLREGTCDLLVGMDVIGAGDFAVSNYQGKTFFSYRHPSEGRTDYTGKAIIPVSVTTGPKPGRNDPCPCGSGKKYKHCCIP